MRNFLTGFFVIVPIVALIIGAIYLFCVYVGAMYLPFAFMALIVLIPFAYLCQDVGEVVRDAISSR